MTSSFLLSPSLPTFPSTANGKDTPAPFVPRSSLEDQMKQIRMHIPDETISNPLMEYLLKVEEKKKALMRTSWKHDLFVGYHHRTKEQVQDTLDKYAFLYFAVEEMYGIPFSLIWTIHEEETNASTEKYPDHGSVGGCMQINRSDFSRLKLNEGKRMDFMRFHPSLRYKGRELDVTSRSRYNDADEIFAAGKYIQIFSDPQKNKYIEETEDPEARHLKSQLVYTGARSTESWVYQGRLSHYHAIENAVQIDSISP